MILQSGNAVINDWSISLLTRDYLMALWFFYELGIIIAMVSSFSSCREESYSQATTDLFIMILLLTLLDVSFGDVSKTLYFFSKMQIDTD